MGGDYGGEAKAERVVVGEASVDAYGAIVFWWGVVWIEGVGAESLSWVWDADGENYAELWLLSWVVTC
jgi:hypothetical protein